MKVRIAKAFSEVPMKAETNLGLKGVGLFEVEADVARTLSNASWVPAAVATTSP